MVGLKSADEIKRKQCQGGCDDDDDGKKCEDGLVCFKRPRDVNSTVPGCCGYSDELDFCVHPDDVPPV